jgi:hypothetical protein
MPALAADFTKLRRVIFEVSLIRRHLFKSACRFEEERSCVANQLGD